MHRTVRQTVFEVSQFVEGDGLSHDIYCIRRLILCLDDIKLADVLKLTKHLGYFFLCFITFFVPALFDYMYKISKTNLLSYLFNIGTFYPCRRGVVDFYVIPHECCRVVGSGKRIDDA